MTLNVPALLQGTGGFAKRGAGTVDLTAAASAALTGGYEPEYVFYHYLSELTVPIPEIAASVSFTLTLRDKTTGRTYSKATEIMALN